MQGKNYTNPEDRGRFGFSTSGKFNTPYKMEAGVIAVTIGAAVVAFVLAFITAVNIMRSNPSGDQSGILLDALIIGGAFLILSLLIFLTAFFIIKFISEGFVCKYIADEDKFTADIGGTHHKIYYKDVQNVYFLPRTLMGKVRGYDVTVKVNGVSEEFAIVSSGYISEKSTPFYIIKERAEISRSEDELSRSHDMLSVGDVQNGASVNNETFSPGMKAQMPVVSAGNAKKEISSMPEVGISHGNGSAVEMPSVGISSNTGSRVIGQPPGYADVDRERGVDEIVVQGTFHVAMKSGKTILIEVIGFIVYMLIIILLYNFFGRYFGGFGKAVALGIVIFVAPFYFGTIFNFVRNGNECRYSANGREFVICSKGKPDEHILYSDVQSVDYKPTKLLWFISGYKVDILTKYGVLKYNYVLPRLTKMHNTQNLPFEEIRKRIGGGSNM